MTAPPHSSHTQTRLPILVLGAIGVVFGDIGTSPLYAFKECFGGTHPAPLNTDNLLGVLSLIFWAIALVVSLKYVTFIMRADNKGEGGILALLALVLRLTVQNPRLNAAMAVLGIFGAALFYGDAVITPAISVLSAVEGLEIIAPVLHHYIVPTTITILVVLFSIQRLGTSSVGGLFGPVTLVWFAVLAVLGLVSIVQTPAVLVALSPHHALRFFVQQPLVAFFALGAVVLAVTGTEALYADMGHFGRLPIRIAWGIAVWPSLILNYFGQGALLLRDPQAVVNPFYLLAPNWFLLPMVALATAATVIASQAVITGAFSLTRQAIQLGFLPRMRILHTSARAIGQIYIPGVNWLLLTGVVVLVLAFRSSSGLAAAYGIAVTGAMLVDSILVSTVMRLRWQWPRVAVAAVVGLFLTIDIGFLSANAAKIFHGGWLPLAIGIVLFVILTTWRGGRKIMFQHLRDTAMTRESFIDTMVDGIRRVPGTAVFMTSTRGIVPTSLLHNLKHNKVLHERVVFLTVDSVDEPYVPDGERLSIRDLGKHFHRVVARYGFMEQPDIPKLLEVCGAQGLRFEPMETSFFLGREEIIPRVGSGMALWRERLFAWLMRNAGSATDFFQLPPNRVVELGSQLEI
ncbi:MAG: potassium transporter Kup [Gammaproteobacteria bacterium]